ncbi:MAG TPA: hypothetical protein VII82_11900 [Polyangiaceae bacterium]|jgi:hypothetical protein
MNAPSAGAVRTARAVRSSVVGAIGCLALPCLVACAAAPRPGTSSESVERDIATLHTSKCGSCHSAPAPKTRTREHLEDAFARHKRRVHLTGEEWAELTDYLALPEGKTARQP